MIPVSPIGTKTRNGKYVTVHSTGNNSTVKFVVSGTNMQDQSISETIFGSNAGQIVKGFKAFKTVSGVTIDKALAGAVKVGTSGGNITLNGSLTSGGVATLNGKFISITSEGNNSGIQFVVTGTDMDNSALTEIITGTKESKATGIKLFKTVTSIKAEGPTLGNITTGVLSGQDEGKEIKFTINRNFNSGKENKLFSRAILALHQGRSQY